jgi:hypothetical protein
MIELTKDQIEELKQSRDLAATESESKSKAKGKGGNIVATSAATSEIIVTDAKSDAVVAADIYTRAFASEYVGQRQKGAEQLQELIIKSGQATRAAIASVDVDGVSSDLALTHGDDSKKALADIFSAFF